MHDRGRPRQQLTKHWRGNIGPQANRFRKHTVVRGAFDQARKPDCGNPGVAVFGNTPRHDVIAAPYQHVSYRFTERSARRDGMQMSLALVLRHLDQIGFGQPRRQFQDRPRDRNIVIIGESAQHLHWCVRDRRQMDRKLGPRLGFDFRDEKPKNAIEQVDVFVLVGTGTVKKERGNALQRFDALVPRPSLYNLLEFRDQREGNAHFGGQSAI